MRIKKILSTFFVLLLFFLIIPSSSHAVFLIKEVDPNPVKIGEMLKVKLQIADEATSKGEYKVKVDGYLNENGSEIHWVKNCDDDECEIKLRVPPLDYPGSVLTFYVIPPIGEEKQGQANIKTEKKDSEGFSEEDKPISISGCTQQEIDGKVTYVCKTGLGVEINTSPSGIIKGIFGVVLSLAGVIALLLIIIAGYRIMTSSGDPEKLKGAKEQLTSAIIGLLFIIFSIVILQIIGVDILRIPGFTS